MLSQLHRRSISNNLSSIFIRSLSTTSPVPLQKTLSQFGGVHGSQGATTKMWRNKALFQDKTFRTGSEAVQLLISEAHKKNPDSVEFLESWENVINSLGGVFDRFPKYAWVMKLLMEPDRAVTFRVAWIDDNGISRMNRGYRIQYSSALGPYEGGLTFGVHVNKSTIKASAFDVVFRNALSRKSFGGAYGGADFDPTSKSDTEIQRFCQSYMSELSKYIGTDVDLPGLGDGVTELEIGYLYGQYKRINNHYGQYHKGLLWGGAPLFTNAVGFGVVHFANKMLLDKGMTLQGKKVLITGCNIEALSVAQKLIEFGAIPITFSDNTGYIYEPQGYDASKMKIIKKIQSERGASIGRYVLSSTTVKHNGVAQIFDIPCDYVIPCSYGPRLNAAAIDKLATKGCKAIIDGVHQAVSPDGLKELKKRGLLYAPFRASLIGSSLINGNSMANEPVLNDDDMDKKIELAVSDVYEEIKATAKEFNTRGDLNAGTNIAAFLRVADVMLAHGSV